MLTADETNYISNLDATGLQSLLQSLTNQLEDSANVSLCNDTIEEVSTVIPTIQLVAKAISDRLTALEDRFTYEQKEDLAAAIEAFNKEFWIANQRCVCFINALKQFE